MDRSEPLNPPTARIGVPAASWIGAAPLAEVVAAAELPVRLLDG